MEQGALHKAWIGLGDFIGRQLMLIVPAGVLIGILFPEVLSPLRPWVPFLFAVMTFQNSMANNLRSLLRAFRHPKQLLAILCCVHLVMPLVAFGIASLVFGPHSPTAAGVLLEYCVPIGASTVMWVGMFSGEISLSLAALLVSTLISPFSIPLTLQALVGMSVQIDATSMMRDMIFMVALPALAATCLNELSGGRAEQSWEPASSPLSRVILPIIVSTNATSISGYMRNLTPALAGIALFMFGCALASLALGYLVAKMLASNQKQEVAISFSCGVRNVSAGAVLATRYFEPAIMFPAVISTLFQQFLAAALGKFLEWRAARELQDRLRLSR